MFISKLVFRGIGSEEALGSLLQGFSMSCQYKDTGNEKILAKFSIKIKRKKNIQVTEFYI